MRGSFLALVTFTSLAFSSAPAAELVSAPLAPKSPAGPKLFSELGAALTGIDFTNPIDDTHPLRYLYASSMCTGGVAIGDFDLDGRPDVFLANGPGENRLFQQTDGLRFKDMGPQAGVGGGTSWGIGCAAGDVDRDGDMDILRINEWNGNAFEYTLQVFRNNGAGGFTLGPRVDWTNSFPHYNEGSHFLSIVPADYNKDGRVDLAVLETYSSADSGTEAKEPTPAAP